MKCDKIRAERDSHGKYDVFVKLPQEASDEISAIILNVIVILNGGFLMLNMFLICLILVKNVL